MSSPFVSSKFHSIFDINDNRIEQSTKEDAHIIPLANSGNGRGELWLGSVKARNVITKLNIHTIISILTVSERNKYTNDLENIVEYRFSLDDTNNANIISIINECIPIMDKDLDEGRNILVHCAAGISRSPTIVIAYLMHRENMTANDAFNHVEFARPCISPNNGFLKQLLEFESQK